MAQVEYREFEKEVLSVAGACPIPTITRYVRNAAAELAQRSGAFRYRLDGDLAIQDIATLDLSVPADTSLVKPISLTIDGNKLDAYSTTMLDKDTPAWREECGLPVKWLRDHNSINSVLLYPRPSSTMKVYGEIAVKPTRDSTGMEEIWVERFFDFIVYGALAKLLAVPSAPWYDPNTAMFHAELFAQGVDQARRIADADDVRKQRKIVYGG